MTLLEAIAEKMKRFAEQNPWQPGMKIAPYRMKMRGLTIEFYLDRIRQQYVLAVVSPTATPTETDYHEICKCFAMPENATPKEILRDGFCGKRFSWTAYVQEPLEHTVK